MGIFQLKTHVFNETMEKYLKLAFLVIGLFKLSECESFSESINSTSNEINLISGENNITIMNSNNTEDTQKPTTASTIDDFNKTSLIEDHGLTNSSVNTDTSNTSSRENKNSAIDNYLNKIYFKENNAVVRSNSDKNTPDVTNYVHSNNITKLRTKLKFEWLSENVTESAFESEETNNFAHVTQDLGPSNMTLSNQTVKESFYRKSKGHKVPLENLRQITDTSGTTDGQETTLSQEEDNNTNEDEKKSSTVTDDYDDYSYDDTTVHPSKNGKNSTAVTTLYDSKFNKTEIISSKNSRSRKKIKKQSILTKDNDISDSSEEVIKSSKDANEANYYSGEKETALTIDLSGKNHRRKSENGGNLKKEIDTVFDDSRIDKVEKDVHTVTETNKNSQINSLKNIIPITWKLNDEMKSLLNETFDRFSSASVTTLVNSTVNHTIVTKTTTESQPVPVTQNFLTIKIRDGNKGTITVKPSNNLETSSTKDQHWNSFLSKNADEIREFEKFLNDTKTVTKPTIIKLETNSVTSRNMNSSQTGRVLKTMHADYIKFPKDSAPIETTTKLETISVKNYIWNSSQTDKYTKSTKGDKHLNSTHTSKKGNSKCPYAKDVGDFDLNRLTGYLQTVYYTMQEKITCFKIFMIKLSQEEKHQYRDIYGDFQGRINWTRCDFEIKAETKLKRKHFLQNTGFPDGVYENKIVVVDGDGAADLDLLPTLIDEDPDQWTPVNNLVFMRDCKSGRVLIFKRNPREKVSRKELKEALFAAGEGFNGRLACRRKDPNQSNSL